MSEPPARPEPGDIQGIAERRAKLGALREKGNAFTNKFQCGQCIADLVANYPGVERDWLRTNRPAVRVAGRIMRMRVMDRESFATIQDVSGTIEVSITGDYLDREQIAEYNLCDAGDIVGVDGILCMLETNELALHVTNLVMLTKCLRPLPEKIDSVRDPHQRYRQRYLDLITNADSRLIFIQRSRIIQAMRDSLVSRRYLEVETPVMHPIPDGPPASAFATHHNALDMKLYLRRRADLYLKRLAIGGFEKIFEINRNFRNAEISPADNPEFTMLAFYCAYCGYGYPMLLIESMIRETASNVFGKLKFTYRDGEIDLEKPFERITFSDAKKERPAAFTAEMPGGGDALAGRLFQPTYVYNYPAGDAPSARRNDRDPEIMEYFKLYIGGYEVANGASELNDPEEHAAHLKKEADYEGNGHYDAEYIRALEHGMAPTAGASVDVNRLVMLLTNSPGMRDVILFPQTPRE